MFLSKKKILILHWYKWVNVDLEKSLRKILFNSYKVVSVGPKILRGYILAGSTMITDFGQEIVSKSFGAVLLVSLKKLTAYGKYIWLKLGDNVTFSRNPFRTTLMLGGGALICAIQLGYYMGMRKFYLYGVDHQFKFKKVESEDETRSAEGGENHFLKNYRSGKKWWKPSINVVEDKTLETINLRPDNKSQPLVDIVVPVFNGERFIGEAIESALNQTYKNIALIIINDGSTDSTSKILEKYQHDPRVTIACHPNGQNCGVNPTRFLGVRLGHGEYIAFLDADDIFYPDKIEKQVKAMQGYPEAVLCHTNCKIEKADDEGFSYGIIHFKKGVSGLYDPTKISGYMVENDIRNSTILILRSSLDGIALGYKDRYKYQFEDWILGVLLSEKGLFMYLDEELITYRCHKQSATHKTIVDKKVHVESNLEFGWAVLIKSKKLKTKIMALRCLLKSLMSLKNIKSI
jgi:glycosyltransferase involved in cell wall biosynthesis